MNPTTSANPSTHDGRLAASIQVAFAAAAASVFLLLFNMGHYDSYIHWPTLYRFPISEPRALWVPIFRVAFIAWGGALIIAAGCWAADIRGFGSAGAILKAASKAAIPLQLLWLYPLLFLFGYSPTLAWLLGFLLVSAASAGIFGYHCPLSLAKLTPDAAGKATQEGLPPVSWKAAAVLGTACLAFIVLFSTLVILQYHAGHLGYADSGFVAEALWNTLHGRFMYAHGFNPPMLLADHFSPVWLAVLPFYALAPRHETLIVVSAVVLAVTAIPVFLLARNEWKDNPSALCLSLAFLLHPAVQHEVSSFSYGFQAEVVAVPFLAFACYFMRRKSWRWFWACIVLVLCCKETLAAIVLGLGLCAFVLQRERRMGGLVMAAAVLWFLGVTRLVLPLLRGGRDYYQLTTFFGYLGDSLPEILFNLGKRLVLSPVETLRPVFHREVWMFLVQMLLPVSLLSLLSPAGLLAGVFHFAMMLISQRPSFFSIFHHYKVALVIVPFLAAAVGVRLFLERGNWLCRLLNRLKPGVLSEWLALGSTRPSLLRGAAISLLVASLLNCYYFGPTPISKTFEPSLVTLTEHSLALARMKERIPLDASVTATHRAGAHFTDRKQLYCLPLPQAIDPKVIYTADYILIDTKDRWGDSGGLRYQPILAELNDRKDYRLIVRERGFLLFQKVPPETIANP